MERIEFETELRLWYGESNAAAGIVRITGEPAEAIRMAALTGQWVEGRKSRKSARVLSTIGKTTWKNSVFPDVETGGWIMPVNQVTRMAEKLSEGDRVRIVIEL